ncbi:MAG: DUF4417 domain-containing protein [Clostridia bacterium]|nr:DUF4417 domain-containing protein [Clostridia bacterium]
MSLEALKRNGHNLELGSFELSGEYGIPVLRPVQLDAHLTWIRFNHALREPQRERYGVHFFIDDYLFQRAWHDPPRYALFLRSFPAVMTPDFSMFADYPRAVQIYNHWRKHQLGAYWQQTGMTVIPSIGWVGRDSYSWCFDGEPVGGTVAVSSVGTQKSKDARRLFLDGYNEMMARLMPSKIIFFGDVPKECEGNIEHHAPYYETFTCSPPFNAR